MRILTGIDVPFKPFGGSLLSVDDWYRDLPDGIEVRFLTLPSPVEKWWSIKDVKFLDIVKSKTAEEYPEYLKKLQAEIEKEIADFKPDILHCQHLNYGLSRAFVDAANADMPKIGICHGTDVQAAASSEYFRQNLQRICDGMDVLLFPNQIMADDLFDVYPNEAKPYVISPHGIPDRYFDLKSERALFDGSRRLEVLYAGRLLAWKGPDIAVEAVAHVTEDMHLTVIGNEDQAGFVQTMQAFVSGHSLQDKVTFIPQMPRDDLLRAFANYDVIVFPSRRLEAFSLTVVEAQAMGLPVVYAAEGGGIASTVGDGGLRLEQNTPEGLARALDGLYRHPKTLAELQTKGRANAEKYKMSASRQRLFDLSERLIAERAGQTLQQS